MNDGGFPALGLVTRPNIKHKRWMLPLLHKGKVI
jgi:hypothetical protein